MLVLLLLSLTLRGCTDAPGVIPKRYFQPRYRELQPTRMNEQQTNRNVMKTQIAVIFASLGSAALLLPGCAVGPNYKRPAVYSPVNFRNAPETPTTNSLADVQWWELYKDETLNALIRIALTNNYDVRIAISRVDQARAVAKQ